MLGSRRRQWQNALSIGLKRAHLVHMCNLRFVSWCIPRWVPVELVATINDVPGEATVSAHESLVVARFVDCSSGGGDRGLDGESC